MAAVCLQEVSIDLGEAAVHAEDGGKDFAHLIEIEADFGLESCRSAIDKLLHKLNEILAQRLADTACGLRTDQTLRSIIEVDIIVSQCQSLFELDEQPMASCTKPRCLSPLWS